MGEFLFIFKYLTLILQFWNKSFETPMRDDNSVFLTLKLNINIEISLRNLYINSSLFTLPLFTQSASQPVNRCSYHNSKLNYSIKAIGIPQESHPSVPLHLVTIFISHYMREKNWITISKCICRSLYSLKSKANLHCRLILALPYYVSASKPKWALIIQFFSH